jgi:Domain of unknown function (DUF3850)
MIFRMVHRLKTVQPYFDAALNGEKSFELRRHDRDFQVGDLVELREWNQQGKSFTGREVSFLIIYILDSEQGGKYGLKDGYCILGLGEWE